MIALLLLLLAAPAHAGYTPLAGALVTPVSQYEKCHRRCDKKFATPTPSPVPSPVPTKPTDCSDGRFVKAPNPSVLQLVGRTYEPGRTYRLCATIPPDAVAPGRVLALSSRNHANTSCGDFKTWLVAPNGMTYVTGGAQPGVGARFEPGTWGLVVVLDKPCEPNKALDYFLAWF